MEQDVVCGNYRLACHQYQKELFSNFFTDIINFFKFRLELVEDSFSEPSNQDLIHNRVIPASVKLEAWKRDKGRCVKCGSEDNLHYDHILPYSKGGSSLIAKNIQILCARHNFEKRDRIE